MLRFDRGILAVVADRFHEFLQQSVSGAVLA